MRAVVLVCVLLGVLAAGAASAAGEMPAADPLFDEDFDEDFELGPPPAPDPLEGVNRRTHALNQKVDRWLLDPITRTYRMITPRALRDAMRCFFWNLGEPTTVVNDLLQREWDDAAVAFTRLVVNSTLGLGGLFDPARSLELAPHESDFGQTLALAGVESGPYLVLPVLGPSTVRDGLGLVVDVAFRPSTFVVPLGDQLLFTTIQGGGFGLTTREQYYDQLEILKELSIDYYSALRSAYAQSRTAEIWGRREHHRRSGPAPEATSRAPTRAARTSASPRPRARRSRRSAAPRRTRTVAWRSR